LPALTMTDEEAREGCETLVGVLRNFTP
jgi:hypothetical protein